LSSLETKSRSISRWRCILSHAVHPHTAISRPSQIYLNRELLLVEIFDKYPDNYAISHEIHISLCISSV